MIQLEKITMVYDGRIYELGEASNWNSDSKRPLTQASLKCSR